ncbi:hypothetical protein TanjilG_15810 [Lupinus angustifolius]|uniref:Phosphoglycolate phosphatase n=1 Tax=Lupinus angustifolius TaxID=3871 RepID=A0A1J7FNW4_LUPAN|nr:hypothetical protein TanjilG_15810 [Lupinus angustifolius]
MTTFTTRASAQPLKNADELIDSVETFIFDCDGVIWKGDSLMEGVPETLDLLRSKRMSFSATVMLLALCPKGDGFKSQKQPFRLYGTLCIRENPGCLFIATNRDAVAHLTDAQEWAVNNSYNCIQIVKAAIVGGSMVGALVGSTEREPLVVGKPSTFMMDYLADKCDITGNTSES